jgi:flagellar hook-associated protein 2
MRESARNLYSFQNPFNERLAVSDNTSALTATANREASEAEHFFTVKQIAEADRFMSLPLDSAYRAPAGNYRFTTGESSVSFNFRGGSITELSDMINQRGAGKLKSRIINIDRDTKSFLIESLQTGAESRLGFEDNALRLALDVGILEKGTAPQPATQEASSPPAPPQTPQKAAVPPAPPPEPVTIYIKPVSSRGNTGAFDLVTEQMQGNASTTSPMSTLDIPLNGGIEVTPSMMLKFETEITAPITGRHVINSLMLDEEETAVQNTPNLKALSLVFDDGTKAALPPIADGEGYHAQQYALASVAGGKTISFLRVDNMNTAREINLRNIQLFDPTPVMPESAPLAEAPPPEAPAVEESIPAPPESVAPNPGYRPRQAISVARDAVIAMDGIEIKRPLNSIDDLIPGVTLTVHAPTETPVRLGVEPDRESVKDGLISLVGNYNQLVAELNVLSRNDTNIIDELTYLDAAEREGMRKKLGVFSTDSGISQIRAALQSAFTEPYRLRDGRAVLISEFGVGTNVQRQGGYSASKLRGYMQIDEKALDSAIADRLPDLQALFGVDTDGDFIIDSGLAYNLDRIARPYVETGGVVTLKTGTLDQRINSSRQRIEGIDRQLAAKEQTLRSQYGQMESAYNQMERMSTALENFGRSNSNNR